MAPAVRVSWPVRPGGRHVSSAGMALPGVTVRVAGNGEILVGGQRYLGGRTADAVRQVRRSQVAADFAAVVDVLYA
jgi:hypothetical protein